MNDPKSSVIPRFGVTAMLLFSLLSGTEMIAASSQTRRENKKSNEAKMSQNKTQTKKRDLVVTRVFEAPVAAVWTAWTDPELVKRWWGPNGFTSPVARVDFREGGTTLVCMRSPDGHDFYNTWTYRKIVPNELIEFVLDWADKDGNQIDPVTIGMPPEIPRNVRHVITFKALDANKTEMVFTEYGYTSDQMFDLSKLGLEQCLDKMAAIFSSRAKER